MMRETHWNILNNLLLIQNLVTYSAFFKKRWLCYPKYHSNCIWWCCKPQLWYCCCCRSCRRPISTFQITCYLFKKPVTYSLLIFRKSIQTAYVDIANSKWDVVVVVDAEVDLYVPLKWPVTYSKTLLLIRPFSLKETFSIQNIT